MTLKRKIKNRQNLLGLFSELFFSDEFALRTGLLQSFSPSSKMIFAFTSVIAASLSGDIWFLISMVILHLILAGFSKINLASFLLRKAFFIPLFAILLALPAAFNLFVPGDSLFNIFHIGKGRGIGPVRLPEYLSVTAQGLNSALLLVLRILSSSSAIILLRLSTRLDDILASLAGLLPNGMGYMIAMSFRYSRLWIDMLNGARLAMTARGLGVVSPWREAVGTYGFLIFKRSLFAHEALANSMKARGFEGELKTLGNKGWSIRDLLLAGSGGFILIISLYIGR
jgi:cobalt/nickel transport system permease protein